jgi:predicted transglutaminase-like cysteine proteinase
MQCERFRGVSFRPLRAGAGIATLVLALASGLCVAAAELGFTLAVTPGLIASMVTRFSVVARPRIAEWVDFARVQQTGRAPAAQRPPESGQLQSVNSFVNAVPWFDDLEHWGQVDYWATPAETFASHGGDCEDFAIAKYFLLKELGVPIERLRITYVRAVKINQPHMVLAYYASPGGEPLILDNLDGRVRPASERGDLVPVYSFNDEDVVIIQGNRKGSSMQIRAWQGLIDRLQKEARL